MVQEYKAIRPADDHNTNINVALDSLWNAILCFLKYGFGTVTEFLTLRHLTINNETLHTVAKTVIEDLRTQHLLKIEALNDKMVKKKKGGRTEIKSFD